jgi:hypothetical protein
MSLTPIQRRNAVAANPSWYDSSHVKRLQDEDAKYHFHASSGVSGIEFQVLCPQHHRARFVIFQWAASKLNL